MSKPDTSKSTAKAAAKALLISIRTPEVSAPEAEASLQELERLVTTLGFKVIGREFQNRPNTTSATALGAGKLKELVRWTGGQAPEGPVSDSDSDEDEDLLAPLTQKPLPKEIPDELATVVVFDCDLRPSQLRHLENAFGVEVFDRTGVIIEIFSRHAKTRAARLQVEIARLNYVSPRLRETGSSGERQSGRGSGESALATERRAIRDRLADLKRELAELQGKQGEHRNVRSEQCSVALVGYTNAGKSSTMRALTGSDVLVEDKLFATLDTTVRAMKPETLPRILISDTVGFIKKLPHDLVASFKSTLDEALHASLLLYVVDASDSTFRSQLKVVDEVLQDVGITNTDSLLILNKEDFIDAETRKRLSREFPKAIFLSTKTKESITELREQIMLFFEKDFVESEIFAPYSVEGILGEIRTRTRVTGERHDDTGTWFTVRARKSEIERLKEKYGL